MLANQIKRAEHERLHARTKWLREEVGRRKAYLLAITNLVAMSDMELHPEANQRKFVYEVYGGVGQRGHSGHLPKTPVLSAQNADANSAAALNAPRKSLPLND